MANDPLSIMATQMNTVFSEFGRGMGQFNAEMSGIMESQFKVLNDMAPHNVLSKMAQGSGNFSGRMSTQDLNQRNIFGAGGA